MSKRDEIEKLTQECQEKGLPTLTAPYMVEAAQNAEAYPNLHAYLWAPSEAELAAEARLARAHRLMISLNITIGDGVITRLLMHTPGIGGYSPYSSVISNLDLAATKLRQLTEDIARARGRLRAFRSALPEDIGTEIDDALAKAENRATAAIAERTETAA